MAEPYAASEPYPAPEAYDPEPRPPESRHTMLDGLAVRGPEAGTPEAETP
ncbi:hypothetical protein ACU686_05630 [Yinghuangia aomiensis]